MNGVIITAVIVLLAAVIGLAFGVLTLQEEVEDMKSRLGDCATYAQYQRFQNDIVGHTTQTDINCSTVAGAVKELRDDFANVKRSVYGTANEPEFCRMKTAVTQTLPDRIKRLEDVIGIHDETEITYDGLVPHQEEK